MKQSIKICAVLIVACIIITSGASGQGVVCNYYGCVPVLPMLPMLPPAGFIAGGLIYGIHQAPQHARPDKREWAGQGQHKFVVRSWSLDLFSSPQGGTPYAHIPGFCSVSSALVHRKRHYPTRYSLTMPSPLPCWRVDGGMYP